MKDKGMKGCTLNAPAEEEVLDLINVTMQQCRNALLPVKLQTALKKSTKVLASKYTYS